MESIIIKVNGGLCNQLFQLANAYQLSLKFNRKLYICEENQTSRNVYWNSILKFYSKFLISNIEFQKMKVNAQIYNLSLYHFHFQEINLSNHIQCYCIEGYYQSFKYFDKNIFTNTLSLNFNFSDIPHPNDLAIHIRRTDYIQNNIHYILSINYYLNSYNKLKKKIKINNIYIFSDDKIWCENNILNIFDHPTHLVTKKNDIEEFEYMIKFKNIIIANSSFSWWAAYLDDKDKIIYSPKNWFVNTCELQTHDLRPKHWNIISDSSNNIFDKSKFNVISLGAACCIVQNIHDNLYNDLGPLYFQPQNKTNFFDWLISDFKSILYIFKYLQKNNDTFIHSSNFTLTDNYSTNHKLNGGWKSKYRKVESTNCKLISLHDLEKNEIEISDHFIEKYKRRFHSLFQKIKTYDKIHFIHCFDFQWLEPYFPTINEIKQFFLYCKEINQKSDIYLYFLIHPKYHSTFKNIIKDNEDFYNNFENLKIYFLKSRNWEDDWKSKHLTFDLFFNQ